MSFVIPSFNDIRILEAISSIQERRGPVDQVEIIVIDGGSREEILSSISDGLSKSDTLIVEKDDGIFDAINKGIKASSGKYIVTLGSDDRLDEFSIELFETASSASVDLINFDLLYTDAEWGPLRFWRGRNIQMRDYYMGRQYPHFGIACTKEVYESVGLFNINNKTNADYEFFYHLSKASKNIKQLRVRSTIVQMRIGGNSSANISAVFKANVDILKFAWQTDVKLLPGIFLKPVYKIVEYMLGLLMRVEKKLR